LPENARLKPYLRLNGHILRSKVSSLRLLLWLPLETDAVACPHYLIAQVLLISILKKENR